MRSSRGLDLIGWLGIEVLPDGIIVYGCSHGNKQMPNGMSEWDDAITFEKDHSQTVADSAHQQLIQPRLLWLRRRRRIILKFFTDHKEKRTKSQVLQAALGVCAHHGKDDQSRKDSHDCVADQLHDLIPDTQKNISA